MRSPNLLLGMSAMVLSCLATSAAGGEPSSRNVNVPLGEPLMCTEDARPDVSTRPFSLPWPLPTPAPALPPVAELEGYILLDSLEADLLVPAGTQWCVHFDYDNLSLADTLLPYVLTASARGALDVVPGWIRPDLENQLRQMTATNQDRYGALLLGLADPRIVDEVAFQVAHLSRTILGNASWPESLLVLNASLMYQIDPDLQFVDILDYDLGGGNVYSTTRYRTIVGGDTVLVELPREAYYWWIVMPKVSDERPLMDASVFNTFWREYLYYHHDEGYPLLREVMAPITVLWDGQQHDWPGGRAFTDSMLAVDAVGNWCSETVPYPASGDRPVQPNEIAHGHNGNCGELQDLLCAAARTCLIPTACTMDILEDHVWCEMWLDDWHPYQVDLGRSPTHIDNQGIAYDRDRGGGKDVSCVWDWRNDGYTWDVVGRYSDACTLTVAIADSHGVPVDNAQVMLASEFYYEPYDLYRGTWGETDGNGVIQFLLGDDQNYYIQVTSSLGNYPSSGYAAIISNSVAGQHYYWNWVTPGEMTQLDLTEAPPGADAPYVIEVEYELPYDVMSGRDYYANPYSYYAENLPDGHLDFFIADGPDFAAYLTRHPFVGYLVAEGLPANHVQFQLPSLEDYFVVLSGAEHLGFATRAQGKVRLWAKPTAVTGGAAPGAPANALLPPAPNPFRSGTTVRFDLAREGAASLAIYDVRGNRVRQLAGGTLASGRHERTWDGRDAAGHQVAPGIYYVRMEAPGTTESRKLVLLR